MCWISAPVQAPSGHYSLLNGPMKCKGVCRAGGGLCLVPGIVWGIAWNPETTSPAWCWKLPHKEWGPHVAQLCIGWQRFGEITGQSWLRPALRMTSLLWGEPHQWPTQGQVPPQRTVLFFSILSHSEWICFPCPWPRQNQERAMLVYVHVHWKKTRPMAFLWVWLSAVFNSLGFKLFFFLLDAVYEPNCWSAVGPADWDQ